MTESEIEKKFSAKAGKLLRARVVKFVSPGNDGMPDRILLIPGGVCAFVELKQSGKKLRPLQKKRIDMLRALGFFADVLAGEEEMEGMLSKLLRYANQQGEIKKWELK